MMLLAGAVSAGCGWSDPCGNEVLSRVPSASKSHVVVVFERGCGATTGFSTHVSVIGRHGVLAERPSLMRATGPGNALIIDERHGRVPIGVEWISPQRVRLTYYPGLKVARAASTLGVVDIEHSRAGEVRDSSEMQRSKPTPPEQQRR